jgi:protein tyrosine phosphatase (PTP) superfamily phosphohydrolase (DUF442 family)
MDIRPLTDRYAVSPQIAPTDLHQGAVLKGKLALCDTGEGNRHDL